MFRKTATAAVGVLLVAGLAGCSQETVQNAAQDTARNAVIVRREAKRAERKARPQLSRLQVGARVTAALTASENLHKTIRADVSEDASRVRLVGNVDTAEQKKRAERITRDTLGEEKTIVNDITVKGK